MPPRDPFAGFYSLVYAAIGFTGWMLLMIAVLSLLGCRCQSRAAATIEHGVTGIYTAPTGYVVARAQLEIVR
jgi:hypothetical protein